MTPLIKIPIERVSSHIFLMLLSSNGSILFKNENWNTIVANNNIISSVFDLVSPLDISKLEYTIASLASEPGSSASQHITVLDLFENQVYLEARLYSFEEDGNVNILFLADNLTDKVRLTNRLLFGFENSSDVIYELDILSKRYNYVSPACYDFFEITQEQALNTRPGALEHKVHVDDFSAVHNHFRSVCKLPGSGKKDFYIRYRYHHSCQGLKWVIDRHTVFYNDHSKPFLLIGNIRDITELQLSQELIARSEKMFKGIVENSIDIISMLDRQGVIQFVSPSIEPILGYKPEDIIHKHPFEFMDTSMHSEVTATMNKLLENPGQVIESEMYFKYANGRDVYLKSKFINYLDDPHIQAILGSTQDITEQKLAEQKLIDSFKVLNQIINNTGDPIWSVDTEMRLTFFNQAFEDSVNLFFGFRPLKGDHFFDAIVEHGYPDQTECRNHFLTALSGKKIRFDRVYEVNDYKVYMDYFISPILNVDGIVTGVTCFGRNITEKMLIYKQLQNQNEDLKKTNREMDRFVYSMSHDLRSPVASALGLIQLMEFEHEDSDSLKNIQMLRRRISRLDALIEDILEFVKQRKEEVNPQRIDFYELIECLLENRGYREETPNMEIFIDDNAEFPIITDRNKLTTIMENLISNAVKYRDDVKGILKLHISCISSPESVTIKVKDNGIGISDKHKEKIFDMFFRATSLSKGSGLGLYITKECLESINGSIQVESVLMEGSEFTIQFKNYMSLNQINLTDESINNNLDNR